MAYPAQPPDLNNIPISSAYNPLTGLFKAIRGWNKITDGSSNDSYAVAMAPEDGGKATYAYARSAFAVAATPTDIAILNGSATKTVRVLRIEIWALTTAATTTCLEVQLIKRSAANTGGTTTGSPVGIPHDSTNSGVTALMLCYTANPTAVGASVGIIRDAKLQPALSPSTATDFPTLEPLIWEFGVTPGQCPVLRGVAEGLAINLVGAAIPAGLNVGISVMTTEE